MKTKDSYLPFFFLCWAFLYTPLALLSAFPPEENEEVVGFSSMCHGATEGRLGFFCDGCQNDTPVVKQGNLVVPLFYRYKQFRYELK